MKFFFVDRCIERASILSIPYCCCFLTEKPYLKLNQLLDWKDGCYVMRCTYVISALAEYKLLIVISNINANIITLLGSTLYCDKIFNWTKTKRNGTTQKLN